MLAHLTPSPLGQLSHFATRLLSARPASSPACPCPRAQSPRAPSLSALVHRPVQRSRILVAPRYKVSARDPKPQVQIKVRSLGTH